jgi:hypothetical protein
MVRAYRLSAGMCSFDSIEHGVPVVPRRRKEAAGVVRQFNGRSGAGWSGTEGEFGMAARKGE